MKPTGRCDSYAAKCKRPPDDFPHMAFGVLRTNKRPVIWKLTTFHGSESNFSHGIYIGGMYMEARPILRGDLYYADLEHAVPQAACGSVQRGARPIVILSNM